MLLTLSVHAITFAQHRRKKRWQRDNWAAHDLQNLAYLQPVVLDGHSSLQDGVVAREVIQVAAQLVNLCFPKALHEQCTQMSVIAHLQLSGLTTLSHVQEPVARTLVRCCATQYQPALSLRVS